MYERYARTGRTEKIRLYYQALLQGLVNTSDYSKLSSNDLKEILKPKKPVLVRPERKITQVKTAEVVAKAVKKELDKYNRPELYRVSQSLGIQLPKIYGRTSRDEIEKAVIAVLAKQEIAKAKEKQKRVALDEKQYYVMARKRVDDAYNELRNFLEEQLMSIHEGDAKISGEPLSSLIKLMKSESEHGRRMTAKIFSKFMGLTQDYKRHLRELKQLFHDSQPDRAMELERAIEPLQIARKRTKQVKEIGHKRFFKYSYRMTQKRRELFEYFTRVNPVTGLISLIITHDVPELGFTKHEAITELRDGWERIMHDKIETLRAPTPSMPAGYRSILGKVYVHWTNLVTGELGDFATDIGEFDAKTNDFADLGYIQERYVKYHEAGYKDVFRLVVGFQLVPSNATQTNFRDYVEAIRAYEPNTDRSFHDMTACSTTTNRLCIFETYYYLYGNGFLSSNKKSFKMSDDVLEDRFAEETAECQELVRKGMLVDFLKIKAAEHDEPMYVEFFHDYKDYDGFRVDPDGSITALEYADGLRESERLVFLYHQGHVAPRKLKVNNAAGEKRACRTARKNKEKIFMLTPKPLKLSDEGFPVIESVWAFDVETYRLKDGTALPYCICCIGKKTYRDGSGKLVFTYDRKSFYIDHEKKLEEQFVDWIDSIATPSNLTKTHQKKAVPPIYVYGFNNSRFDNHFVLDAMLERNKSLKYNIPDGSSIKSIKYHNVKIMDIALFYAGSLRSCAEDFKLVRNKLPDGSPDPNDKRPDLSKGVFPYAFADYQQFGYVGVVPELSFWESEHDRDTYLASETNGRDFFDMKAYTIKYCMLDAQITLEMCLVHLKECHGYVEKTWGDAVPGTKIKFDCRDCSTGAGLALKYFQQVFLRDEMYGSKHDVLAKEKLAFFGGRTEVFKKAFESHENETLGYYDINSSYPASMCSEMPFKFETCSAINPRVFSRDELVPTNLYFASSKYVGGDPEFIPSLLVRSPEGDVIATANTDFSYHWGCSLIDAIDNGCEITISEILKYESRVVFKDYSETLYAERLKNKKTNPSKALFQKLLLNSLFGKMAQRPYDNLTICSDSAQIADILSSDSNKYLGFTELPNGKILVKYSSSKGYKSYIGQMMRLASYITAKSRCNLSYFMRSVGHSNVYYCDTDSVFTNATPPPELLSNHELGKWKLEDKKGSPCSRHGPNSLLQNVICLRSTLKLYL